MGKKKQNKTVQLIIACSLGAVVGYLLSYAFIKLVPLSVFQSLAENGGIW